RETHGCVSGTASSADTSASFPSTPPQGHYSHYIVALSNRSSNSPSRLTASGGALGRARPARPSSGASPACQTVVPSLRAPPASGTMGAAENVEDRKSTRLNSSHVKISYAVFCLKKK